MVASNERMIMPSSILLSEPPGHMVNCRITGGFDPLRTPALQGMPRVSPAQLVANLQNGKRMEMGELSTTCCTAEHKTDGIARANIQHLDAPVSTPD